ncbi:LytR C-terminal domain-containing protein [Candidatus Daviesbacteria bacterium]|nr:LytR C-terminal domain-containing protein [Candidatus Daviesbacteria bacterium]
MGKMSEEVSEEDFKNLRKNAEEESPSFRLPSEGAYSNNQSSSGVSKPALFMVGIIILLLIGTTGYLLRGKFSNSPSLPSPSPSLEITTPEPSPTPLTLDRSKYTIRILNGTSKSGLAASISAELKDLGYKIGKTGNATNSAFLKTVVRVKEGVIELSDQLIKDLSPDFEAEVGAPLKSSEDVDGEVILGAK